MRGKIRIIGGQWRSRLLSFPQQPDLRPTPDRIRETLFNWLGQDLSGKNCLDLFAGSGVLGFEAASRGAKRVTMVESDVRTYAALQENKEKLQAVQVDLIMMNALSFINHAIQKFDIIFLDPPYRLEILPQLLPQLAPHLMRDGQVYVETQIAWTPDMDWQVKRKGKAGVVHYQLLELAQHE